MSTPMEASQTAAVRKVGERPRRSEGEQRDQAPAAHGRTIEWGHGGSGGDRCTVGASGLRNKWAGACQMWAGTLHSALSDTRGVAQPG
jgi:hypothetical protein